MAVRTYNPSVRVGNWNEDVQLEEDTLKDFLERRERGQLLMQKSAAVLGSALGELKLSVSRDGKVHFGDTVMLVSPAPSDGSRSASALSVNVTENGPGGITGSGNTKPSPRNAFVITSMDGSPVGQSVKYGQSFYLCTLNGEYYLSSDRASFQKCAKKSRHNEVSLVSQPSHLTDWCLMGFDPRFRMETEFCEVDANAKAILTHVKTNQSLCLEKDHSLKTMYGREFEVSCFTTLDSHKAERDVNHWMIVMEVPADETLPVTLPQQEAPPTDTQQ